jgi:hypothetical protein
MEKNEVKKNKLFHAWIENNAISIDTLNSLKRFDDVVYFVVDLAKHDHFSRMEDPKLTEDTYSEVLPLVELWAKDIVAFNLIGDKQVKLFMDEIVKNESTIVQTTIQAVLSYSLYFYPLIDQLEKEVDLDSEAEKLTETKLTQTITKLIRSREEIEKNLMLESLQAQGSKICSLLLEDLTARGKDDEDHKKEVDRKLYLSAILGTLLVSGLVAPLVTKVSKGQAKGNPLQALTDKIDTGWNVGIFLSMMKAQVTNCLQAVPGQLTAFNEWLQNNDPFKLGFAVNAKFLNRENLKLLNEKYAKEIQHFNNGKLWSTDDLTSINEKISIALEGKELPNQWLQSTAFKVLNTDLSTAIRKGDTVALEHYLILHPDLDLHASIEQHDGGKMAVNPLMLAVASSNVNLISILVESDHYSETDLFDVIEWQLSLDKNKNELPLRFLTDLKQFRKLNTDEEKVGTEWMMIFVYVWYKPAGAVVLAFFCWLLYKIKARNQSILRAIKKTDHVPSKHAPLFFHLLMGGNAVNQILSFGNFSMFPFETMIDNFKRGENLPVISESNFFLINYQDNLDLTSLHDYQIEDNQYVYLIRVDDCLQAYSFGICKIFVPIFEDENDPTERNRKKWNFLTNAISNVPVFVSARIINFKKNTDGKIIFITSDNYLIQNCNLGFQNRILLFLEHKEYYSSGGSCWPGLGNPRWSHMGENLKFQVVNDTFLINMEAKKDIKNGQKNIIQRNNRRIYLSQNDWPENQLPASFEEQNDNLALENRV